MFAARKENNASKSQESTLELPEEVVKPLEPAISHPVARPAPPKPVVRKAEFDRQLAVVESVREVRDPGEAKGVGAAGGAFAGHQIERHARGEKRWEIAVRLDDGSQRTLSSEVQPVWHAGDRVRLVNDKLQPV